MMNIEGIALAWQGLGPHSSPEITSSLLCGHIHCTHDFLWLHLHLIEGKSESMALAQCEHGDLDPLFTNLVALESFFVHNILINK